jgi:hypothetical protein
MKTATTQYGIRFPSGRISIRASDSARLDVAYMREQWGSVAVGNYHMVYRHAIHSDGCREHRMCTDCSYSEWTVIGMHENPPEYEHSASLPSKPSNVVKMGG